MAIVKMIFDDRDVPMSWHEVESFSVVFGQEKGTASIASYSNGRTRQKELQAKREGNGSADYSVNRISIPVNFTGDLTLENIERALLATEYFNGGERQRWDEATQRGQRI